jgi:predicted nucleic acid-binding protein
MYLLDTSLVSELRRPRPHPNVVAWLRSAPESNLRLSAVTLGEIQRGIESLRSRDERKAAEIQAWADQLEATWAILPVDTPAFRLHARLMRLKPAPNYEDALIAAVAIRNGLTVVTRNVADFAKLDAPALDPFAAGL